jgi:hypothetical protein
LVDRFHNRPALAVELLREALGQTLPAFKEARIESADLAEIVSADRRADLVVVLADENQQRAGWTSPRTFASASSRART